MSLNGLDVAAVVDAHQSALADPGGWFLLKYINRDTVDVLSRGNGGVSEAKCAVEKYEEKSPVYGMLQYRRKRVLLKYVPEGTSRLLQVRLTVQFQSILDVFPHDTIFSFTSSAELVESALGLCTMLQPANGGSLQSSSSSLRQRRLNEISEVAEEFSMPVQIEQLMSTQPELIKELDKFDDNDLNTLPPSAVRAKALLAKRKAESRAASQSSINLSPQPATRSAPQLLESTPVIAEPLRSLGSLEQLKHHNEVDSVATTTTVRISSMEPINQPPKRYHHSRHLSENESKNISQWNEQVTPYVLPTLKPKKKLAPRPHVEPPTRPKTANQYEDAVAPRPVANLPQTVRLSNRATPSFARPGSQQSSRSVPTRFLPTPNSPPPLPDFGQLHPLFNRPESRKAGSVVSSAMTDAPNASPEKLRLMKALQNRKRNQLLTQRATSSQSNFTSYRDDFPLGEHRVTPIPNIVPMPATIREEAVQAPQENKSIHNSSTASPTSIATMSDDHSTRPSSVAEDRKCQPSQKSASRDTDSSSTPKADTETVPQTAKKHTSWYDSAPELNEDEQTQHSATTTKHVVGQVSMQSRQENIIPTINESEVESDVTQRHDRSAFSWLASDSQLNMVQTLLQAADEAQNEARKSQTLRVDSYIQPHTESSSVMSDDDDALVEELKTATVHEAKSMSVSRPPLTHAMRTVSIDRSRPGTTSTAGSNHTPKSSRSIHSIQDKSPGNSLKTLSTALPQLPADKDDELTAMPLTRKTTVSHDISKRIKALEDSSRKETSVNPVSSAQDTPAPRSTLSNLMKRTSLMSPFQTSNISADQSQVKNGLQKIPSKTPLDDKSNATRQWLSNQGSVNDLYKAKSNTETSSIKSRTMRDPKKVGQPGTSSSQRKNSAALHTLLASEKNRVPTEAPITPSSDKKRFSFASYRSGPNAKVAQSEPMTSRISLNTKESKFSRPPASETSSVTDEKRGSRASRLMKRVSGFGSRFGGKGQQNPLIKEEVWPDPIMEQNEPPARAESVAESSLLMIDIGDVNVQFPESLLWKRRFLRINDQGYLIFSAPTENPTARSTNRKFHLADVQEPCLPDVEREEMAWSILLDLRDGNCVQCACESKQEQKQVLKMLLDAHNAYHSLYPDALE